MTTKEPVIAKYSFASLLCATVLCSASLAYGLEKQHVRPVEKWEIESVSDDGDDIVDFCLARTYYNNGIIFILARDKFAQQRLALNFPDSRRAVGASYPVTLSIDSGWKSKTTATATGENMLVVTFEDNLDLLRTIGKGYRLTMQSSNDAVEFDLEGAGQALEKLNQCIRDNLPATPLSKDELVSAEAEIAAPQPSVVSEQAQKAAPSVPPQPAKAPAEVKPIPSYILGALKKAGHAATDIAVPHGKGQSLPLDLFWQYDDILAGYKTLPTKHGAFATSVKSYINTLRPICSGPFIAEASPVYTVGNHYFMHAEIGCSSDKRDSIASLLFFGVSPTDIDALYFEAESTQGSEVITIRNKVSHELEVISKKK